ncbi:MAG TPA: amidohydrolase, partial [Bacillota bacterium]|nr:amidohydrolase [Bacillota bacterium]
LTACNETPILEHQDLAVEGKRITFIQPHNAKKAAEFLSDRTIDGRRLILLPGLVNSHCHAYMVYFRNYGSGLNLQDWLYCKIFPAEARLTEEDCAWGTALGLLEMLRGGITAVADMPIMPSSGMQIIEQSGMRVATGHSVFQTEFNPPSCKTIFRNFESAYHLYHNRAEGRMKVYATVHSGYLYPPQQLAEGAAWLKANGYRVHTHLHETTKEVEDDLRLYGKRPLQRFAELGLLGPGNIAAHCLHLNDEERRWLSESQTLVVPCPTSNLRLAAGMPDIPALLQTGAKVALGTDGSGSGNALNLWKEMHLASLLSTSLYKQPGILSDNTVLQMVTATPAQAIFGDEKTTLGKLCPGATADLIAVSTEAPHFYALNDPLSAVVHHTLPSDVSLVMVDGTILMEQGQFTTLDAERISYEVEKRTPRLIAGL